MVYRPIFMPSTDQPLLDIFTDFTDALRLILSQAIQTFTNLHIQSVWPAWSTLLVVLTFPFGYAHHLLGLSAVPLHPKATA
jgi:hypothetical protein